MIPDEVHKRMQWVEAMRARLRFVSHPAQAYIEQQAARNREIISDWEQNGEMPDAHHGS